jgi:carbonic anhydrase
MAASDLPRAQLTRRGFVTAAGSTGAAALAAAGLGGAAAQAEEMHGESRPASPAIALRMLMQGNERWVRGLPRHPHQSVAWRRHLAGGQKPFATVLSCIDSRVPPEIVFDRGLGDLFVARTGAPVLDDGVVLGSVEFGPNGFPSTRLIFVLGHARCGAVSGAISAIQSGRRAPGQIQAVVDALRPAYRVAIRQPGDLEDNMIRAQTRLTVERLKRSPLLRRLIRTEGLLIVGGHYNLDTGRIRLIA